jgi:hypothetical protein
MSSSGPTAEAAPAAAPFPASSGTRLATLLRLPDWWHYKLPPLLAVAYLLLAADPAVPAGRASGIVALFLAAAIGTAAFGHLANDFADLEPDARIGRPSGLARLAPAARRGVLALALALALAPWFALPPAPLAWALVGVEIALFLAYSLPPLRLKERGAAGVVADALYGHAVPVAVVWALFTTAGAASALATPRLLAALFGWKLAQGLCDAVASQLADRRFDRRSGTRTFVLERGPLCAQRLLLRVLLPLQLAGFLVAGVLLWPSAPWLLPVWAVWLAAALWKIHRRWRRGAGFYRRGYPGWVLVNDFQERWLPLAALAALVAAKPWTAPLALAHVALFRSGLHDLAAAWRKPSGGA